MQAMRSALAKCVAAASTSAATLAVVLRETSEPASSLGLPASGPTSKVVHELSFAVPSTAASDFSQWLTSYVKQVLQEPGMQGAKVLYPTTAPKPGVVFVLGGPGAGKGTQCSMIVEKCGYTHLSAGDLLRAERKSGSAQGQMIDEYIKEGKIVPVEVTVKLLIDAIRESGAQRVLVDGFPRNTNNLSGWQQVAGDDLDLGGVLFYDCPEDVMQERLLERGKTSGRTDDNLESIKKRFDTYLKETMPILSYYEHQELVHKIDGTREVGAVWADSQKAVDAIEKRLCALAVQPTCVHLYSTDVPSTATADVVSKAGAAAAKRFGEGTVAVQGRQLNIEGSFKAYDLDALKAFD
mmetsp:Transcript_45349/g.119021  ORF Transcript_45349/g.119021 Transcript_45349/m.119021 type:complete len:352 (-) Transcript_45349:414-1469(-)